MNLGVVKNAANFFDGQLSGLSYSRRILIHGNDRLGSPSAPQPQQRSPGIHYMGPVNGLNEIQIEISQGSAGDQIPINCATSCHYTN
jgi:hypothetical protein